MQKLMAGLVILVIGMALGAGITRVARVGLPSDPTVRVPFANGSTAPPASCVYVPAGRDLAALVQSAPTGTSLCLNGVFTLDQPVTLKDGQSLFGPASLRPATGPIAYGVRTASRSTIVGLEISGFRIGIENMGDHARIQNNVLHHNDRSGVGGPGDFALITDNEVHDNGSSAYFGCCAAGIKYVGSSVTVTSNWVHDNRGVGIWADLNADQTLIDRNRVESNLRRGIFFEVSGGAIIRRNLVLGNNESGSEYGGGIVVGSSNNVRVYANTLSDNRAYGIRIWEDKSRGQTYAVSVRDNFLNGDRLGDCNLAKCASNE